MVPSLKAYIGAEEDWQAKSDAISPTIRAINE